VCRGRQSPDRHFRTAGTSNNSAAKRGTAIDAQQNLRRSGFLKGLAGGLTVAGGVWIERGGSIATAAARPSAVQDRAIFNFALLLEYLKASFYAEALAHARLKGDLREFAEVAGTHEREHVQAIKKALGPHARSEPRFHFGRASRDPKRFQSTAVALEDLAVAAYNAQAANLTKDALAAAIKIVSVEGRHAAWIRSIAGEEPAPRAADAGKDVAVVISQLKKLHVQ
jgi:hypothetical protein